MVLADNDIIGAVILGNGEQHGAIVAMAMKIRFFATIIVVLFTASAAEARMRDDVMSGAFRCAAIGNGRDWLDCYYGAAQPLRGQLGLPPAPDRQIRLATAASAGSPMPLGDAQARDEVMSEAFRCTSIEGDRQWLDCYYAAAQLMRTQLGLPPAPQAQSRTLAAQSPEVFQPVKATAPPAASLGGGEFGFPRPPPKVQQQTADHIVSHMAGYRFDQYGIFTMTLANGQVWRQIEGDTAFAKFKAPAGNYFVTIQHGFFGSYNLTIKGVPGLFRVHRIS
jgi:hypothetical protein